MAMPPEVTANCPGQARLKVISSSSTSCRRVREPFSMRGATRSSSRESAQHRLAVDRLVAKTDRRRRRTCDHRGSRVPDARCRPSGSTPRSPERKAPRVPHECLSRTKLERSRFPIPFQERFRFATESTPSFGGMPHRPEIEVVTFRFDRKSKSCSRRAPSGSFPVPSANVGSSSAGIRDGCKSTGPASGSNTGRMLTAIDGPEPHQHVLAFAHGQHRKRVARGFCHEDTLNADIVRLQHRCDPLFELRHQPCVDRLRHLIDPGQHRYRLIAAGCHRRRPRTAAKRRLRAGAQRRTSRTPTRLVRSGLVRRQTGQP